MNAGTNEGMYLGCADHPQDERLHHTITRTDERFDLWRIIIIFGIAMPMLHDLNSQKCNNHLVSFIKVVGLFVSYIVDIFDTIKSEMTV